MDSTYPPAVLENFGAGIDFAQLIKQYITGEQDSPDWYKAARFVRTIPAQQAAIPMRIAFRLRMSSG